MTAAGVASSWKSAGRRPIVLERAEEDPVVGQDDLPGDRAEQEAREERRDDQEQQQVLVAAAAERDRVGEREAEGEGEDRGQPAVHDRAGDPRPVLGDRLRVDAPVPGLREPVLDVPGPQRHEEHLEGRVDEEDGQPQQAGQEQRVRGDGPEADRPAHRRLEAHAPSVNASLQADSSSAVVERNWWSRATQSGGREDQRVVGELGVELEHDLPRALDRADVVDVGLDRRGVDRVVVEVDPAARPSPVRASPWG